MLGTIIINTVCIFFDCFNLLRCYRYFSLCLVLYVLTYFNTLFSLTHCVCTYWWITYFHSQLSLQNGWSVLGICSLTRFSPLASGLLLKCPLLVFFFRCLVCHSPLFDYRCHKDILDRYNFNPLNPELNPICYLLALLAHHFLHVSRIGVKSLTIRLLMSYIYGAPILDVSRSHTTTHHSR